MPDESRTIEAASVAEAYLALLADRGIEYLFGNAGTDFPSIIEAFAKSAEAPGRAPVPVTVPHETVAVAMAHGYYMVSGRPQAVMFHVNVGTANGLCGLMNAARENVPILFTAGRTPILEAGEAGARSVFIHWAQEMFDQAGMLREMVKWDYELRAADQLETVIDRALALAMTEPRGPVYLSLPREVLARRPGKLTLGSGSGIAPASPPAPDPAAIERAAGLIAAAENPLVITSTLGRDVDAVPAFASLAERFALPVVSFRPRYLNLPSDHPMHLGYEPAAALKEADVVVVIDSDVPWIPSLHPLRDGANVIHLGSDPHYGRYPVRGFPADLAVTGATRLMLPLLAAALAAATAKDGKRTAARRARIAEHRAALADAWAKAGAGAGGRAPITTPWLVQCLGRIMGDLGDDAILISETQLPIQHMALTRPGSFFGTPVAGGLGWGLGAALGAKLAARDRTVILAVGDGAYMFGAPTPAHFVGAAMDLPTLTVIVNNRMWGSVRKATLGLYPDGAAARSNRAPFTYLEPAPAYEKIVEACGGVGFRVEAPDALEATLRAALDVVRTEQRQAVVNVLTGYADDQALADARR